MKFLFSSLDCQLVEGASRQMLDMGVLSEIRVRNGKRGLSYRELWVAADPKVQWAIDLLAMHCEIGRN